MERQSPAVGNLVAHVVYATGIGLAFALRYALAPVARLPAKQVGLVAAVLTAVAAVDYGLSLWLERRLLTSATPSAAVVVCAGIGAGIALYGIVLWLLGAGTRWWAVLVGLAFVHWVHSFLRWSRREELPADRQAA